MATDKEDLVNDIDDYFSYKCSDDLMAGLKKLTIAQLKELLRLIKE